MPGLAKLFRDFPEFSGIFRNLPEYPELPGKAPRTWISKIFLDFLRVSGIFWDCPGLSGISKIFLDFRNKIWSVWASGKAKIGFDPTNLDHFGKPSRSRQVSELENGVDGRKNQVSGSKVGSAA